MGPFPKSKRHAEIVFTGAKNIADAVDKMATVAVAFGFGDPSGAALTIAGAVAVSAKTVGAISAALAEIAKTSVASAERDHRTTLVLCIANEAYFPALEDVLTPQLGQIGQAEIPRADGSDLEATIAAESHTRCCWGSA